MLENHAHPMIRHRQVPIVESDPPFIPVPVEEPPPSDPIIIPAPVSEPITVSVEVPVPSPVPVKSKRAPKPIIKPQPKVVASPDVAQHVTCIIVNFKTKRLTKQALTTFLKFYPDVHVILVDNGSHDDSVHLVRQAGNVYPKVHAILHDQNIGHGPALHKAITHNVNTTHVFTLDSDCIVNKLGFLEKMLRQTQTDNLYAIGWRRYVDMRSGVPLEWHASGVPDRKKFIPYIHPCASLYNVHMYRELYPFIHHGAPCVKNMLDASKQGFKVCTFPIFNYVTHLKAGTRRMYQGRWDPKTGDRPGPWNDDQDWPI